MESRAGSFAGETYPTGTNLSVDGNYGDIHVVEGTPGEVSVVFEPFNYRAHEPRKRPATRSRTTPSPRSKRRATPSW